MRRFCEFSESFDLARDSLLRWRWTRELVPPLSQPPSRPPPSHPFIPPQLAGIKEVGKTKERRGYLAKQIVAFCARCREFKTFARAASLFTPPFPLPSLLYTCLLPCSSRPSLFRLSIQASCTFESPETDSHRVELDSRLVSGASFSLHFGSLPRKRTQRHIRGESRYRSGQSVPLNRPHRAWNTRTEQLNAVLYLSRTVRSTVGRDGRRSSTYGTCPLKMCVYTHVSTIFP